MKHGAATGAAHFFAKNCQVGMTSDLLEVSFSDSPRAVAVAQHNELLG